MTMMTITMKTKKKQRTKRHGLSSLIRVGSIIVIVFLLNSQVLGFALPSNNKLQILQRQNRNKVTTSSSRTTTTTTTTTATIKTAAAATTTKRGTNLFSSTAIDENQSDVVDGESPKKLDNVGGSTEKKASKRQMLKFAVPALGIYLANPLLSNIDNAFVGKTVGTQGLAALSPATICTDQLLLIFLFLSRAATALVSTAYGGQTDPEKQREAASKAGSPPLTVALIAGIFLSAFYAVFTPKLLEILKVDQSLRGAASSYIYWRGAIAWAALAQSVSLSIMMATRDAITPLKIIALAAIVNVIGDYLLCVWPLRWGCSGAAAATAFATLFSSGIMISALRKKRLLPTIRLPTRKEFFRLMDFTGPLLAITAARLIGFINMQTAAMRLGVKETAAYQLSINIVTFFLLFAEPLSQLCQTLLPSLIEVDDGPAVKDNLKSILSLGFLTSLSMGIMAGVTLFFGSSMFSLDLTVQALAKGAAPSVFVTVATSMFSVVVDGAMLASRDFSFMLLQAVGAMSVQIYLLYAWCQNISDIYTTFTLRLGSYATFALIRIFLGFGNLGKVMRMRKGGKAIEGGKIDDASVSAGAS